MVTENSTKKTRTSHFCGARHELYLVDDLIFRINQIIIPTSLQRKVIKAAHRLGHLCMTKTKKMLWEKYWFPAMNSAMELIISQCFECQVTTKQHRQEPVKTTGIPKGTLGCCSCRFWRYLHRWPLQFGSHRQENKIPWSCKDSLNSISTNKREAQDHVCHLLISKTTGKWQWATIQLQGICRVC